IDFMAVFSKRVNVSLTHSTPINKFNASLVSGMGPAHKLIFIYTQRLVKETKMRYGRLADTDRANLLGLHKLNGAFGFRKPICQRCCGHPTGGTATEDNDFFDWSVLHISSRSEDDNMPGKAPARIINRSKKMR